MTETEIEYLLQMNQYRHLYFISRMQRIMQMIGDSVLTHGPVCFMHIHWCERACYSYDQSGRKSRKWMFAQKKQRVRDGRCGESVFTKWIGQTEHFQAYKRRKPKYVGNGALPTYQMLLCGNVLGVILCERNLVYKIYRQIVHRIGSCVCAGENKENVYFRKHYNFALLNQPSASIGGVAL